MAYSDRLCFGLMIDGEHFVSFSALGAFINEKYPEKIEDFQQKYGKY
jgi:hypothetical protein